MNKSELIEILGNWRSEIVALDPHEQAEIYKLASAKNRWFTSQNMDLAISGISRYLQPAKLIKWLDCYELSTEEPKDIGIIMAGNIPLVGFHDLLCTMVTGNTAQINMSSQDDVLLPYLLNTLFEIEPAFKSKIRVVEKMEKPDVILATGSDNTYRYFNFYFKHLPRIIRKNRTSIAILSGEESQEELKLLGEDIFQYFGLGCRNVSKLFVPDGFNPERLFEAIGSFHYLKDNNKYHNNYDYNRSILLINKVHFRDNGFALMYESDDLVSPVSVIFIRKYDSMEDISEYVEMNSDKLQCIVSRKQITLGDTRFGKAQHPEVWDYADNVDTLQFLLDIKGN